MILEALAVLLALDESPQQTPRSEPIVASATFPLIADRAHQALGDIHESGIHAASFSLYQNLNRSQIIQKKRKKNQRLP